MSTTQIRQAVHNYVDQLDEKFLHAVMAMMEVYVTEQNDPIAGYDIRGNPVRASVLKAKLDKEVERARKGEYLTLEEMEKEMEKW